MNKMFCDKCGEEIKLNDLKAGAFLHINTEATNKGGVGTQQLRDDLCGSCADLVREVLA